MSLETALAFGLGIVLGTVAESWRLRMREQQIEAAARLNQRSARNLMHERYGLAEEGRRIDRLLAERN